MRIHRLELQAFGPFPGHESVDFDALDHGILLVNGPTGSGKTSLLDAVAFALFGDVPGSRRALRQSLRSHHAPPHVAPWVSLEFSVGGTRWKVHRTPQWDAPKKRGSGMTTRPASVVLSQWREGQWVAVSQRIDEASDTITQILGMGLDQFAQVVLLPQGEFAQFLRARPEDRRVLLERLFDVARFDHMERWFTDQKNERTRSRDASLHLIQAHLTVVDDAVSRLPGEPLKMPEWDVAAIPDLPEHMRTLLAEVRACVARAEAADAEATAMARGAERMRESAAERLASLTRYHRAVRDLEAWPPDDVDAMKRRADAAGHVIGVLKIADRADRAAEEVATARARIDALVGERNDLLGSSNSVEGDSPDSPANLDALHPETLDNSLDAILRAEATLQTTVNAHEAHRRASAALQAAVELQQRLDREHGARNAELSAALDSYEDCATALQSLPDPSTAKQAAMGLSAVLRLVPARSQEREQTQAAAERATRAFADAEAAVLSLRQARLTGIAGEIAAQLVDGDPCPVCGSPSHPGPAKPGADAVSPEQIESAEQTAAAADARRLTALAEQARAEEAWQGLLATVDERRVAVLEARPALVKDPEWAAALPLIEDGGPVAALMTHLEADADRRRAAEDALTASTARAEQCRRRVAEAEKALAAATAQQESAKHHRADATTSRNEAEEQWSQVAAALREARPLPVALTPLLDDLTDTPDSEPASTGVVERAADNRAALDTASEQYRRLRSLTADLLVARREAATAAERAASAARELEDELVAKGFDDRAQAESVAMPENDLADLRERWQTAIEVRAAAQAVLQDADVLAAALTPSDDPRRLDQRAEILSRRASEAKAILARWATAASTLDGMRHRLADAIHEYLPRARAADEMADLAATFSGTGENTRRMRLTSYVLAAHLETVTAMANERLARMSDGRYQLQYTDERARGTQRSGLGIAVLDAWTGLSRDTATLSGGEAFMASLALALGLGDAVRADSGGMELNTLFVDEGFGSLDQDTLEEVMGVLDGLREGGRLVGIVSHVTELRARIPTHIEIRKTSDGSTVHTPEPDANLVSSTE